MKLFKIEAEVKEQGAEVRSQGSGIRNCVAGFTLIELMVVVAIMSIVIGLAYSTLRTPNEQIACKYIYSEMQLSKMRAVSSGATSSVNLDTLFDEYDDVDVPGEANFLTTAPSSAPPGESLPIPGDGIDFGGSNIANFTSKGMVTSAGSVYLFDVDNTSRICAVTVLTTGIVRIWTSNDGGANWN